MSAPSANRRPLLAFIGLFALVVIIVVVMLIPDSDSGFTDGALAYDEDLPVPRMEGAPRDPAAASPLVSVVGLVALVDSFFPGGDATAPGPLADLLEQAPLPALPDALQPDWQRFIALRRQFEAGDSAAITPAQETLTSLRAQAQRLIDDPPHGW